MAPPVHILDLPVEVAFFILDRLPHDCLVAFSSCSRQCRGLSLPLLFRSMALSPESIAHLEAKEDFERLRLGVTEISINTYRQHIADAGIDTVLDHLRICLAALTLFPHMKNLSITLTRLSAIYAQTLQFDRWVLDGIFLAISTSLGERYSTLEHLSLNIPRVGDDFSTPVARIKNHISEVNQRFLGLTADSKLVEDNIPYPPGLRTTTINIDYDNALHDSGLPYLNILKLSSQTLESLEIYSRMHRALGMWTATFQLDGTWPRVRNLLLCHSFLTNQDVLEQMAQRFPNVEEVEVIERFLQRGPATASLHNLRAMKMLRQVTLPWAWEGTLSVVPMPLRDLERAVDAFVSHGLQRLERVVFTTRIGSETPLVGKCAVQREQMGRWSLRWVDPPSDDEIKAISFSHSL
ncbi:hypothetical protein Dda_2032 [Drechslerella dactyloides]|uniref:F-box domain-containing protein n=1 Tax=Drechslerella dactyloides TaxID=74499 RepID=A0AAD6NNJ3_DREDA|nr:hypothetical protein Dda_2032 [Drechslerella dactyloides]